MVAGENFICMPVITWPVGLTLRPQSFAYHMLNIYDIAAICARMLACISTFEGCCWGCLTQDIDV